MKKKRVTNQDLMREIKRLARRVAVLEKHSHQQGVLATHEELERRALDEAAKNWKPGTGVPFPYPQHAPLIAPEPSPFGPKIYCSGGAGAKIC